MSGMNCIPLEAGWPNLCIRFISEPFWISCTWAQVSHIQGGVAAAREGIAPSAVPWAPGGAAAALPAPHCSLGAGPQPSWQLWSAGDAFPGKPSTWEGCTVPTEALRSREWFWPDSAGCAEVHPYWVKKCVPGAFGIAALGAPGKRSCLRGASKEQPGPCIPWESRAPPAQVLFLRKCWVLKFRNSKTQEDLPDFHLLKVPLVIKIPLNSFTVEKRGDVCIQGFVLLAVNKVNHMPFFILAFSLPSFPLFLPLL